MARIRSIKPEFWTDEKIVELSPLARLLFIGMWNFADDQGRMVYSPKRLKLQILPADAADVAELVGEIRRESLVTVYDHEGVEYIQVNGFERHQKVDKRVPSKLPPPPNYAEPRRETPPEGKGVDQGMDQGGDSGAPATADADKPSRKKPLRPFPEDFALDEELAAYCRAKLPAINPKVIFENFKNHHLAKGTQFADWRAAFRTWVGNEVKWKK